MIDDHMVSDAPWLVSIAIVAAFLLAIFLIARAAETAAHGAGFDRKMSRKIFRGIVGFYLVWMAYASALSLSGFLYTTSRPPRTLVFLTLPLTIFLLGYVLRTKLFRTLLEHAKLEDLIRIHVFRIIGGFFIILYALGKLPGAFALRAGPGDVFAALTAPIVAWYVASRKAGSLKLALAWNIVGVLDILLALGIGVALNIQASKHPVPVPGSILEFAKFPNVFVPAMAAATILFLHIAVFMKLRLMRQDS